MPLTELLNNLDYDQFPQYYLKTDREHSPDIAPLLRSAKDAGVNGIYVFQSGPSDKNALPLRPAVYVAEAQTTEKAREIHRSLWNLGKAPFLIVLLPTQIRVYTGFDYSWESPETGLLEDEISPDENSIRNLLADFNAESINTGNLWRKRAKALMPDGRVDRRLLKNLSDLGKYLREEIKLKLELAHALIGKYVYIRYLRDRNILSDEWLEQHSIDIDSVFGRHATKNGLRKLVEILDDQLNGSIFPIDFSKTDDLNDDIISLVASIFNGDQILSKNLKQLALDFKVYNFEYIPIETLSSIYEQFLHTEGKGKKIGAFYTPEYLADYLLSEMNAIKPLRKGMRILDPSCGSGVFLVLTYRQLIEMELEGSSSKKLPLERLSELLDFVFGVEREQDACFVAEFGLILTLLHYIDPLMLLEEKKRLPSLHNTHIFQYDFFDDTSPLWYQQLRFDWIVGNPPWIQADEEKDRLAITWIEANKTERPVSSQDVAEAFSWRVLDLLEPDGCACLIMPAASLYNIGSKKYRQRFFHICEVLRVTDFSNLRKVLFEGKAIGPAATILYRNFSAKHEKPLIEHYGPFFINQTPNTNGVFWTITINENEFHTVSPYEVEQGDSTTWKIALWGTHRDRRAIAKLRRLFPETLGQLCKKNEKNDWHLHEGSQLRFCLEEFCDGLESVPQLIGKRRLDTDSMNRSERLFSIPEHALKTIPEEECFVRIQGGMKGLLTSEPPHLIMNASWKYVIYSDEYFVIKPRQIGLSAPPIYADYLRALSVFLSTSIARYYLFFQTPSWGIERDRITLKDVKSIPIPHFTSDAIEKLADLQKELVPMEIELGSAYAQNFLDKQVALIFEIPNSINTLAAEFNRVRSKLIEGGIDSAAIKPPEENDLLAYAQEMADELDAFITSDKTRHRVTIEPSQGMLRCTVELVNSNQPIPVAVEKTSRDVDLFAPLRHELHNKLEEEVSQWVYIKRGLRIFTGPRIYLYKVPHLINWTRTQALNDADDLIAEVLGAAMSK